MAHRPFHPMGGALPLPPSPKARITSGFTRWMRRSRCACRGQRARGFPSGRPIAATSGFSAAASSKESRLPAARPKASAMRPMVTAVRGTAQASFFLPRFRTALVFIRCQTEAVCRRRSPVWMARVLSSDISFPRFLPDGRHFVFFVRSAQPENIGIKLGSLDQPQTSFLLRSDTNAEYSTAGYLIFMRGEKILAQRFDAEARSLRGDPVTLVEQGNRALPLAIPPCRSARTNG